MSNKFNDIFNENKKEMEEEEMTDLKKIDKLAKVYIKETRHIMEDFDGMEEEKLIAFNGGSYFVDRLYKSELSNCDIHTARQIGKFADFIINMSCLAYAQGYADGLNNKYKEVE
jgi:hypothetical protein